MDELQLSKGMITECKKRFAILHCPGYIHPNAFTVEQKLIMNEIGIKCSRGEILYKLCNALGVTPHNFGLMLHDDIKNKSLQISLIYKMTSDEFEQFLEKVTIAVSKFTMSISNMFYSPM